MKTPLSQFAGEYQEWGPAVALREHVSCVWTNDLSLASVENFQVVPDGCVDILWNGKGLHVAGPDSHPILEQVGSVGRVLGVRFLPGAAYKWLGVPLSEILNSRVPLTEFWGPEADDLRDSLYLTSDSTRTSVILQQALIGRLARIGAGDRLIAFLRRSALSNVRDFEGGGIRKLAQRMGISERTLRRRSMDAFGYGFKTLQRILRFQRLFRLAGTSPHPNLVDLAEATGFADQAHMSREVRRLCDATAAELVAKLSQSSGRFVQDEARARELRFSYEKRFPFHSSGHSGFDADGHARSNGRFSAGRERNPNADAVEHTPT